ncbi:MAG: hypothetical protein RsTaC01_1042 [Candidatus Paraimprobicoccus trichonymphae]|uniref:Uncharacterized protein n=1 Tax=Candidatus Paraimprobicoccus trichonymphae TaxID=3033793 RepID=A0AA48KWJ3_9FIRM|nr:MAG: hypothetical protein RsTaC01_1042 [Candidatus Paraimprobicoccus trichonymphae]
MNNNGFVTKAKDILRKEKSDITENEIRQILETAEKCINSGEEIEDAEDLNRVAGGAKLPVAAKVAIELASTLAGAATGAGLGLLKIMTIVMMVYKAAKDVAFTATTGITGAAVGAALGSAAISALEKNKN